MSNHSDDMVISDEHALAIAQEVGSSPERAALRYRTVSILIERLIIENKSLRDEADFAWKQHQSAIDDSFSIELSANAKRYAWLRIHGAAPCEDDAHHLDRGLVMRCNVLDDFIDGKLSRSEKRKTQETGHGDDA